MNQEYFDYIARELDKELAREAERIVNSREYTDEMSERKDKFWMSFYPCEEVSEEEAIVITSSLVDVFKKIVEKNDDFNTNMLAFLSLYNFLKMKKISEKVSSQIIKSIGEVFAEEWEKSYFSDLLIALDSLEEIDFERLIREYPPLEITYMCLTVAYMQKNFEYVAGEKKNEMLYCISKISNELRMAVFTGYLVKNPEIGGLKHYQVYLPQLLETTFYRDSGILSAVVDSENLYEQLRRFIWIGGEHMRELEEKYNKIKVLQDERYRIVRDFSHTYENMQAMGLKEIANILMDSDDSQIKRCGRVILAEYGMKDSLKAEVSLLRLNFEDKQDDIARLIRNGITSEKSDSAINITDIFEEALKICLLRVIYSGSPRGEDLIAKGMYKRIKARVGSMKEFVQNFENEVIVNGISIKRFLKDAGINIEFCSDDEWNNLYFEKNKHAEVLIRSIFAELITNSFKYANLNDIICYSLKLKDDMYMIIQSNTYTEPVETESGVGLESKGEILKKINGHESYFIEKTFDELGSGKFTAIFLLNCKVFNIREDGKNE